MTNTHPALFQSIKKQQEGFGSANINTDAGLQVVIELVGKNIYTITLCVCVYVRKTPESGSLVVLFTQQYRLT